MAIANERSSETHSADFVSEGTRRRIMKPVRQRDTRPERTVRTLISTFGDRYRLKKRRLAGSPDLSNQTECWAIFAHGRFWHGHRNSSTTEGGEADGSPARPVRTGRRRSSRTGDAMPARLVR